MKNWHVWKCKRKQAQQILQLWITVYIIRPNSIFLSLSILDHLMYLSEGLSNIGYESRPTLLHAEIRRTNVQTTQLDANAVVVDGEHARAGVVLACTDVQPYTAWRRPRVSMHSCTRKRVDWLHVCARKRLFSLPLAFAVDARFSLTHQQSTDHGGSRYSSATVVSCRA